MLSLIKLTAKNVLNMYPDRVCKQEYESQNFTRFNERPIEFGYVFRKLGELYPREILDVGTGTTALPHMMSNCGFLVTATDNVRDYWSNGMHNRHYHVIDDDITKTRLTTKFDMVTCISTLEHIEAFDVAVRNMFSLLKTHGHLILTFPYSEHSYVRNVYALPGSSYGKDVPYVTHSYSRRQIDRWSKENNAIVVDQEYWQCWDGEYWTVGKQIIPPIRSSANEKHQLSCVLMRKSGD